MRFLPLAAALLPSLAFGATLQPRTAQGFDRYAAAVEARIGRQEDSPNSFLWMDSLPKPRRAALLERLANGTILVRHLRQKDARGQAIPVPDGWIHDYLAVVYIPQVSVAATVRVLNDYSRFPDYFKPQITEGQILNRRGNDFKVRLRFVRTSPVTITLDMLEDARLRIADQNCAAIWTHSYWISQLENVDKPNQHPDPPGHDSGYLWRMNTYWAIQEWRGGVILENETLILSRTIPYGLEWLVLPIVNRVAASTMRDTLAAAREAIRTSAERGSRSSARRVVRKRRPTLPVFARR